MAYQERSPDVRYKSIPTLTTEQQDRFWAKVDKTSSPSGCWLWTAGKTSAGYPEFVIDGSLFYAHRISYAMRHGATPDTKLLMHSCDIPACVNPLHLVPGSIQDNNQDCLAKGRNARGEANGSAKLTDAQVLAIRERAANGDSIGDLCAEYSVNAENVRMIRLGKTWTHLDSQPYQRLNTTLTDDQVKTVRLLRAGGEKQRVIAEMFGVSQSQISRIICGLRRKEVA